MKKLGWRKTTLSLILALLGTPLVNPRVVAASAQVIGPGGGGALVSVGINPYNDNNFLVATDMSGTFASTDQGNSFTQKNVRGTAAYAFNPHEPQTAYALNRYLHVSHDGGKNWQPLYPKASNITGIQSGVQEGGGYLLASPSATPNGNVLALVVDPEVSGSIYFVTAGVETHSPATVYHSSDNGQSWQIHATFAGAINSNTGRGEYHSTLLVDPRTPTTGRNLYLFTDQGLHRINHDGTTTTLSTKTSTDGDLIFDPVSQKMIIYLIESATTNPASFSTQVSYSDDEGATWHTITDTLLQHRHPTNPGKRGFLDVAVSSPNDIYVIFNNAGGGDWDHAGGNFGVALTHDGGATWTISLNGWNGEQVTQHSWIEYLYPPYPNLSWSGMGNNLVVSKTNSNLAMVTGAGNVYATTDGGITWQALDTNYNHATRIMSSAGIDQVTSWDIDVDPFDSQHIFASYTDIGLFESRDGGSTWTRPTGAANPTNTAYAFAFDPDIEGFYLAGFASRHDLALGRNTYAIMQLADAAKANPNSSAYATREHGGVSRTTDGGVTWSYTGKSSDLTLKDNDGVTGLPEHALITDITIDPLSPKDVNQRVIYVAAMGFGVYRSTDGGQHWQRFINGIEIANSRHMSWKLEWNADYSRLYVLYGPTGTAMPDGTMWHIDGHPAEGPVFYLNRNETTWKKLASMPNGGMPENSFGLDYVAAFNGMSFDQSGNIYAAGHLAINFNQTPSVNFGGAWISNDDGASWTNIYPTTVNVYDIKVDSRNNQVVYMCTTTGQVFVSYNGANTTASDWISLDDFSFSNPTGVHEDPTSNRYLYVTTFGGGIWRLELPRPVTSDDSNNHQTSGGDNFSVPQASQCDTAKPVGQADLFQINATTTTATLYWTPVTGASDYAIFYKRSSSAWDGGDSHAVTLKAASSETVNSFTINDLLSWADYDFRVVPLSGCAAGDSSNQLSTAKAGRTTSSGTSYYRY